MSDTPELPEGLNTLIDAYGEEQYACGEWNEHGDDRAPFDDYCKKADAAKAALVDAIVAALRAQSENARGWIACEKRLPDTDGALCLVYLPDRDGGKLRADFEYYHFIDGWATDERVTHWMPLPKEPK